MRKNLLVFLLAAFAAFLPAKAVDGQYDITINKSTLTNRSITESFEGGSITLSFDGSNSASLKSDHYRWYTNEKLTVSVTGNYLLDYIEFTTTDSKNVTTSFTCSTGSITSANKWDGNASSVVITAASQARIQKVKVQLTSTGGTTTKADPQLVWTNYENGENSVYPHLSTFTADLSVGTPNLFAYSNAMKNTPTGLTYSSTNENVAKVESGIVTLVGVGTTTLTATYPGNDDYKTGSATCALTVTTSKATPTITFDPQPGEVEYGTTVTCTITDSEITVVTPTYNTGEEVTVNTVTENKVYTFDVNYDVIIGVEALSIDDVEATKDVEYTVKRPAAPVFSPDGGEVKAGTEVTISHADNKSYKLQYTVLGDNTLIDETTTDAVTSAKFTVNEAVEAEAYAVLPNGYKSVKATADYTIWTPTVPEAPVFTLSGTTATVTSKYADKIYIAEYSITGHINDFVEYTEPLTINKMHRRFVAYGKNEIGQSAQTEMFYTFAEATGSKKAAAATGYKLITDVSELANGDKLIFVSPLNSVTMSNASNKNNRKTVAVTLDNNNNISNVPETALVVELKASGDKDYPWQFLTTNYAGTNGYFKTASGTSDNNYLLINNTASNTNDKATIEIDATEKLATITFNRSDNKRNIIAYNKTGSNSLFACYNSSTINTGYSLPYIYKQVAAETKPDYSMTVSYTCRTEAKTNDAAAISALSLNTPTTGNAEMTTTAADGIYTFESDNIANVSGAFTFTVENTQNIKAENCTENNVVSDFHSFEGYNDSCETEHPAHVYVSLTNPNVKLVNAEHTNAIEMSTNPNEHHGFYDHYANAKFTVTLDPFKSATLSFSSESSPTSVDNIAVDNANGIETWYNLQGVRVDARNAAPGIYIVRNGNTARKVMLNR